MKRQPISTAVFPETSGIYIFRNGEKVLYVGQTCNFKTRLNSYNQHQAAYYIEAYFPNATVELIDVPVKDLNKIERKYIAKHNPPLNGKGRSKFLDEIRNEDLEEIYFRWKYINHPNLSKIGGVENARRLWNEYVKQLEQSLA